MKREYWIRVLWSFALSFGLSLAATMSITSAFNFHINTALLAGVCFLAALLGSICFALPLGFVPVGAGIAALTYLLYENYLQSSLEAILNRLSRAYNTAYGWGIFRASVRTAEEMEPDIVFVLCVLGGAIALLISWSINRKNSSIPGILVSAITMAPCFLVNDRVPGSGWLFLYFLCFLTLILTGSVREKNAEQGNRLCLIVAPITAFALLILFLAVPKNNYRGQERAQKLSENVFSSHLMQLFLGHTNSAGSPVSDGKTVNLRAVGYRVESHSQTLEVTAPTTGTLYLRGRAMDLYDGVSWTSSGDYHNALTWPGYHLDKVGEVKISTRFAHQMLYIPYYATITDMRNVTLGIENEKQLTDYSFTYRKLPEGSYLSHLELEPFQQDSLSQYIRMDPEVYRWAGPLAQKLCTNTKNPYEMAQRIAAYVRNSAFYDTNTSRMPAKYSDFARWFLEESDTGYCVHFATATTVLLQAAGLPARYVTGYTAEVAENTPTPIYADQAHAWTEYWLPGFGWAVLESTPGVYTTSQPEPTVTEMPTETPETAPTESQPSVSEIGSVSDPSAQKEEHTLKKSSFLPWLSPVLIWISVIIGAAFTVLCQHRLRLRKKRKLLLAATNNQKALIYWQEIVLLCRVLKTDPDQMLLHLTQRAKFSQHTLTAEDLRQYEEQILLYKAVLRQKNLPLRVYYRYILALY